MLPFRNIQTLAIYIPVHSGNVKKHTSLTQLRNPQWVISFTLCNFLIVVMCD